jgi:hypothetical protein
MSLPTFDDTALFDEAARDRPGPVEARIETQHMPGVDGQFAVCHGQSGRQIEAGGRLAATGSTPAEAHQALKAALRTRQLLADGQTVADYVGTDASTYPNCLLQSYEMTGPVEISRLSESTVLAGAPCRAILRQLLAETV